MKPILIAVIIVLSGCGPGARLRKAQKLILQAEAKGATWSRDTVWRTIQVPVPEIRVDSVIVSKPGDTVVISKDRLQVKYVRLKGDTVFIEAACLPDTVYQKEPIYITNEIKCPKPRWRLIDVIGASLLFLVIGFVIGKILR